MTLTGWVRRRLTKDQDTYQEAPPADLDGREQILLVDATSLGTNQLPDLVTAIAGQTPARRVVILHPSGGPDGRTGAESLPVTEDLAGRANATTIEVRAGLDDYERTLARLGAGRVLRAVPSDQAALLVADVRRPLVWAREGGPRAGTDDATTGTSDQSSAEPVFIGGTGRSGTWSLGRMLGTHPRSVTVHTELRFHSENAGFPSVLSGARTPEKFAGLIERRWFDLNGKNGGAKGLQLVTSRGELRRALGRFLQRVEADVPEALGQLMLDLVGPYVRGRDGLRWAETTPDNAAAADTLTTVLPMARVLHTLRDGRDVAASVVTMPWGPDTFDDALDWWVTRVRAADRGMGNADPGRVHTVRLEELIHVDREQTYAALMGFLGIADDAPLRQYFDQKLSSEAAHVGRWRRELGQSQRAAFDRRYRRYLEQLDSEGVVLPVDPDVADSIAGR